MVTKTTFKTKDYTKVKFTIAPENAETVAILGLNSDWQNPVSMSKKKEAPLLPNSISPKKHNTSSNTSLTRQFG
jgi:hypothetical protein